VTSVLHEKKIPMVDMRVQVYSKFRKIKIKKKVKYPISMRNETFNTSKCRGKLPKALAHSPNFQFFIFLNIKNSKKRGQPDRARCRLVAGRRTLVAS
jgi:hypothetical protein